MSYVAAPLPPPPPPIQVKTAERSAFFQRPGVIWLIAAIIIIIFIIFLIIAITGIERETLEIPPLEDIQNLNTLVNLKPDGLCCQLPATTQVTDRYVFEPNLNRTYSLDTVSPLAICAGLMDQDLEDCLAEVADENGDNKIIAHRGTKLYYTFALGEDTTACSDFVTCPVL